MSQIFSVRKFFAEKTLTKTNSKHGKTLGQIVKFDQHQFHGHTMGEYISEIGAKSTLPDGLPVSGVFGNFSKEFQGKILRKKSKTSSMYLGNVNTCNFLWLFYSLVYLRSVVSSGPESESGDFSLFFFLGLSAVNFPESSKIP